MRDPDDIITLDSPLGQQILADARAVAEREMLAARPLPPRQASCGCDMFHASADRDGNETWLTAHVLGRCRGVRE